jgi:hypothetical protein
VGSDSCDREDKKKNKSLSLSTIDYTTVISFRASRQHNKHLRLHHCHNIIIDLGTALLLGTTSIIYLARVVVRQELFELNSSLVTAILPCTCCRLTGTL